MSPSKHHSTSTVTPPIRVRGCRVHNLKNIDVDVPRGKLIVLCGLSGSGKTSLAIDTLHAEGQRSYIESFSAYTRQYVDQMEPPDCDSIEGIPPSIAVTRASPVKTNRSTVATATEIAEHARLLFAKAGQLFCHSCGQTVTVDDPQLIAAHYAGSRTRRALVGFPEWLPNRTAASEILLGLQQEGYLRLILKGETFDLSDNDRSKLARRIGTRGCDAIVVVDRLSGTTELNRWTESIETAMTEGGGRAVVFAEFDAPGQSTGTPVAIDNSIYQQRILSNRRRCERCDIDYPDPAPRLFNFNHPLGACPTCEGFGDVMEMDMSRIVPDTTKTIREGAIAPWNVPSYQHELEELLALADDYDVPVDVPFDKLKAKHLKIIVEGVPAKKFGGLNGFFAWLDRKKYKLHVRVFASRYRSYRTCSTCGGKRLKPESLAYKIADKDIASLLAMRCDEVTRFLESIRISSERTRLENEPDLQDIHSVAEAPQSYVDARQSLVAAEPIRQMLDRLAYLESVGLSYLQLNRTLRTLSSGETQRIALTSALGSTLVGMLYVLDEPTAGLHPHDVTRLIDSIVQLRDRGNTVVVVEHNETLIRMADRIIEIGPGAGTTGGNVTFEGSSESLLNDPTSLTAQFMRGEKGHSIQYRRVRRSDNFLELRGAAGHNLKSLDVRFPLGTMCVVRGRSGSGKSSLIHDTLYGAVTRQISHRRGEAPPLEVANTLPYASITGGEDLEDCQLVDQSPISRSPRSCPVTFAKAFDGIRTAFAETVDARIRNFQAGHFSFNSSAGQCAACEGAGVLTVDMQFLADVSMRCPECRGRRYRDEVLQVRYRDRTIADVLEMTVREAYEFFRGLARVQAKLKRLMDVGLDYVALGQPATTLSSGEAQRLKLAAFLAGSSRQTTLFLMDEPTTGLHFADVMKLIECFDALIADGHSLIIIEHHPMLIAAADHIIEIGPGAGDEGGQLVFAGPQNRIST